MTETANRAQPLIAVVNGSGVAQPVDAAGALSFTVSTKAEAKLALTYADGIILTGGGDVNPQRYGQKPHKQVYGVDHSRDKLEFYIVKKARERGIPVMGICRGSQVLNVAYGGTLDQHIYDSTGVEQHWGTDLWVKLSRRSRLAAALSTMVMRSSHFHHQAVERLGEGLRAIAWAGDGTIEAIESAPGNPHYVLGLQFHPEMDYHYDDDAMEVFRHFAWNAAARFANRRKESAAERLSHAEAERPISYTKVYSTSGWRRLDTDDALMESYLTGNRDDWEYQEWQYLNARGIDEDTAEEIDAVCDGGKCVSPAECLAWGDCAVSAIQHRELLRSEHANLQPTTVQWQSAGYTIDEQLSEEAAAECAAVEAGKRGGRKGWRR